jgi:threonine/homoserine/homoserine lactone efflux protein
MFSSILQGLILGFAVTAIPGAVVLETTRRALAKKSVMSFLLGSFLGIGLIVFLAIVGLAALLRNAVWSHVFYVLSGLTLLVIGLTSLRPKERPRTKAGHVPRRGQISGRHRAFIAGIILATANPISVIFWMTTIGRYFTNHESYLEVAVNALAIIVGAVIFFGLLLLFIRVTHRKVPQKYLVVASDSFGVIIVLYGGFILAKVF